MGGFQKLRGLSKGGIEDIYPVIYTALNGYPSIHMKRRVSGNKGSPLGVLVIGISSSAAYNVDVKASCV